MVLLGGRGVSATNEKRSCCCCREQLDAHIHSRSPLPGRFALLGPLPRVDDTCVTDVWRLRDASCSSFGRPNKLTCYQEVSGATVAIYAVFAGPQTRRGVLPLHHCHRVNPLRTGGRIDTRIYRPSSRSLALDRGAAGKGAATVRWMGGYLVDLSVYRSQERWSRLAGQTNGVRRRGVERFFTGEETIQAPPEVRIELLIMGGSRTRKRDLARYRIFDPVDRIVADDACSFQLGRQLEESDRGCLRTQADEADRVMQPFILALVHKASFAVCGAGYRRPSLIPAL